MVRASTSPAPGEVSGPKKPGVVSGVMPSIAARAAGRWSVMPSPAGTMVEVGFCELVRVVDHRVAVLVASLEADDADLVVRVGQVDEELGGSARGLHLGGAGDTGAAIEMHAVGLVDGQHAVEDMRLVVGITQALRLQVAHAGRRSQRPPAGRSSRPCVGPGAMMTQVSPPTCVAGAGICAGVSAMPSTEMSCCRARDRARRRSPGAPARGCPPPKCRRTAGVRSSARRCGK